jgi:hypothetical protein
MKHRRLADLSRPLAGDSGIQTNFVRGLVASGLLAVVQDPRGQPAVSRRTLRRALQGGASLAAGSFAARAWGHRDLGGTLAAVAIGAASVVVIERLLQDQTSKESNDGQEKA